MTLAQAVNEILQRSDEAFIDVSEARARRCFYLALTNTLRAGQFTDTDAFGFIHERIHTFAFDEHVVYIAYLQDDDTILALRGDPYLDPLITDGDTFISRATEEERRNWGIAGLRPVYDRKYYQIGNRIIFMPEDAWEGIDVHFVVVTAPPPYDTIPGPHVWSDATNLLNWMSVAFLDSTIEAATQLFRQEVIVHDG